MEDRQTAALHVAKYIRSNPVVLVCLVLILAAAGFSLPRYQPYFFSFEHKYADLRTRLLSPRLEQQYGDIIFVQITESELEGMTYRSPIDRAWLADLVLSLDEENPSVIALDILIDQPTEIEKDLRLVKVLSEAKTPIVLASVDDRFNLTPAQKAYNQQYIEKSGALSGFVNVTADPDDFIRKLPFSIDPEHPDSFADVVAGVITGHLPPKPKPWERISWLQDLDHKTKAFSERPANFVKMFPAKNDITGKIILVGADLPSTDKHKTPFAGQGRMKTGTSGSYILTQIIAQRLDGRRLMLIPPLIEFCLYVLSALAGLIIIANSVSFGNKARLFSTLGLVAILVDLIFFKFFSLLVPTAMILFVLALSSSLPTIFVRVKRALYGFKPSSKRSLLGKRSSLEKNAVQQTKPCQEKVLDQ